jgi:hypothetical protein
MDKGLTKDILTLKQNKSLEFQLYCDKICRFKNLVHSKERNKKN